MRIGNRREIDPDKGPALVALQRLAYTCAHQVVANSRAAAARLRQERVRARAISIVANGIDLSAYRPRPARMRLRRITTVANLRAEKAHETLIESAARLVRDYPDIEFQFVGGGRRRQELHAIAERLGVAHAVRFLGHREDIPALLAESDIFALTSRSEAFPNAVLEAMAAGLPVVASDVGGVSELIEHRKNGVLVRAGDVPGVAAALGGLIERPDEAAALGEAARRTVDARFSFDRMVNSFENLYLELLDWRTADVAPAAQLSRS